jgi:hypothetical protein
MNGPRSAGHATFALLAAALIGSVFLLTLVARSGDDLARIHLRRAADDAVRHGAQAQAAAADFVAATNLLTIGLHGATAALLLGGTGTAIAWMTAGAVPAGLDMLAQTADLAGDILVVHHELRRAVDTLATTALPAVVVPAMLAAAASQPDAGPLWPLDPLANTEGTTDLADTGCLTEVALPTRRPFGLDLQNHRVPSTPAIGAGALPTAPGAESIGKIAAATALKLAYAEFLEVEAERWATAALPAHRLCELQHSAHDRGRTAWRREADRVVAEISRAIRTIPHEWTPTPTLESAWDAWRMFVPDAPASPQALIDGPSVPLPQPDQEPLLGLIGTLSAGDAFHGDGATCADINGHLALLHAEWQPAAGGLPTVGEVQAAIDRRSFGDDKPTQIRDGEMATWLERALCRVVTEAARLAGADGPAWPLRLGRNWPRGGVGALMLTADAGSALSQARPYHRDYSAGDLPLRPGFVAVPTPVTVHHSRWPSPWQAFLDAGIAH